MRARTSTCRGARRPTGRSTATTAAGARSGSASRRTARSCSRFRTVVRSTQTLQGQGRRRRQARRDDARGHRATRRRPSATPGRQRDAEGLGPALRDDRHAQRAAQGHGADPGRRQRPCPRRRAGPGRGSARLRAELPRPDVARRSRAYRRRETLWQSPGACAKLVFAPAHRHDQGPAAASAARSAARRSQRGRHRREGQVDAVRAGEGTFSPDAVEAPSPSITYTPTGQDRQKLKAKFRATSTAGVADGDMEPGDRGPRALLQGHGPRVHRPARARRHARRRELHAEHVADELDDADPLGRALRRRRRADWPRRPATWLADRRRAAS